MAAFPLEYKGYTLNQLEEELGLGNPAREGKIFKEVYRNVEVKEEWRGDALVRLFITPVGEAQEIYRIDADARREGLPFGEVLVEHPIKDVRDYKVFRRLFLLSSYGSMHDRRCYCCLGRRYYNLWGGCPQSFSALCPIL